VLATGPSWAVMAPRHESSLKDRVLAPASLVATVVPEPLSRIEGELASTTRIDIARFRETAGPAWTIQVDRRSGGMALVEGSGIPWNGDDVSTARAFIAAYPSLFQVAGSDLVLDAAASTAFGADNADRSAVV